MTAKAQLEHILARTDGAFKFWVIVLRFCAAPYVFRLRILFHDNPGTSRYKTLFIDFLFLVNRSTCKRSFVPVNAFPICVAPSYCGFLAQEIGASGRWVVLLVAFGGPDETKCAASKDVEDPTEIPKLSWTCKAFSCQLVLVRTP